MSSLLKKIPAELLNLTKRLQADLPAAEIYLVGGAVRDLLINRPTKDYDLLIRQVAADQLESTLAKYGEVNLVGKTFGVFKWQPTGWADEAIDVALPRTEYTLTTSGRYRDFAVHSNPNLPIEQDLGRRDFTINALAINLQTGQIIDEHHGQTDLQNKLLRTVGKPLDRLQEDLSRALRALRFSCQLNFAIDDKTLSAIRQVAEQLTKGQTDESWLVPRETIAKEFLKGLLAEPAKLINLYQTTGYLEQLLPEVANMRGCPQPDEFHSEGDVLTHTILAFKALVSPAWKNYFHDTQPTLNLLLAILLHDIGKPLTITTPATNGTDRIRTNNHDVVGAELAPQIIDRLKLTSYIDSAAGQIESRLISWLVGHHLLLAHGQPADFKPTTIYKYFLKDHKQGQLLLQLIFADTWATRPRDGRRLLDGFDLLFTKIKEVEQSLPAGKLQLLLNGQDIMTEFKLTAGPQIGELLKLLEEAQVNGLLKNKAEALEYLKKNIESRITNYKNI